MGFSVKIGFSGSVDNLDNPDNRTILVNVSK